MLIKTDEKPYTGKQCPKCGTDLVHYAVDADNGDKSVVMCKSAWYHKFAVNIDPETKEETLVFIPPKYPSETDVIV